MTTNSPNSVDGDVQELISDAEAIIELFESAGAINQIAYKLAKIAHASLTAVPKRMRQANGESSRTWVECGSDYHRGTDFYTTPPAQILRPVELPDEAPNALIALCQQVYDSRIRGASVAHDVWQDCLDELFQQASEVKS
ncbi:hypothetical protein [Pantoea ananatis]|uniref:hypothetical protein n=1 Tax=Pantoea ananas TaxID=553 RepID=UPI001F4D3F7C|nr:hypothetical protein [Pantoea ananatis]MCH9269649.1 hypothetical protein [Pantoea ananatis]